MGVEIQRKPDERQAIEIMFSSFKNADNSRKITAFRDSLTEQQRKIVKAVVTGNAEYVKSRRVVDGSSPEWSMTVADLNGYVNMAIEDPVGLVQKEDFMLQNISREADKFPDTYENLGRRARYRAARLGLHERVNILFNGSLPELPREQEIRRIQSSAK